MMHARQSKEELKRYNSGVKTNCFTRGWSARLLPRNKLVDTVRVREQIRHIQYTPHHTTQHSHSTHARAQHTRSTRHSQERKEPANHLFFISIYEKKAP